MCCTVLFSVHICHQFKHELCPCLFAANACNWGLPHPSFFYIHLPPFFLLLTLLTLDPSLSYSLNPYPLTPPPTPSGPHSHPFPPSYPFVVMLLPFLLFFLLSPLSPLSSSSCDPQVNATHPLTPSFLFCFTHTLSFSLFHPISLLSLPQLVIHWWTPVPTTLNVTPLHPPISSLPHPSLPCFYSRSLTHTLSFSPSPHLPLPSLPLPPPSLSSLSLSS